MRFKVAPLLMGVLLYGCGKNTALRNYSGALTRLSEYKDAGTILYEPRYLDAQKALAAMNGVWGIDRLDIAEADSCLSDIKLYRSYLGLLSEEFATLERHPYLGKDSQQFKSIEESKAKINEFLSRIQICVGKIQQAAQ